MTLLSTELGRGWGESDEAHSIAEAARDVAAAGIATPPPDAAHAQPPALRGLPSELGWHGALVPKALGGGDLDVALLAPVAEALGIAGSYPAFAMSSVDTVWLLRQCATPEAGELLRSIAEGHAKPVFDCGLLPGEEGDRGLRVVLSRTGDAQVVRVVVADGEVPGAVTLVDRLQPSALESTVAIGAALDAAALVGLGRQALALTVAHARTRNQFDHPVGTFQAVQHHCVDMFLMVEQTRTLTVDALRSLRSVPSLTREVMFAKIKAAEMSIDAFRRAHRIHGGIGYSSDCPLGALTRSALVIRGMHGSAIWHRARLRELLRTSPASLSDSGVHSEAERFEAAPFVVHPTGREAALPNSQRASRGASARSPGEG